MNGWASYKLQLRRDTLSNKLSFVWVYSLQCTWSWWSSFLLLAGSPSRYIKGKSTLQSEFGNCKSITSATYLRKDVVLSRHRHVINLCCPHFCRVLYNSCFYIHSTWLQHCLWQEEPYHTNPDSHHDHNQTFHGLQWHFDRYPHTNHHTTAQYFNFHSHTRGQ